MVLNALWPVIAHANPNKGLIPVVICTANGFQTVDVGSDGKNSPAPTEKHVRAHCPLCLSSAHQVAILAPMPGAIALPAASTEQSPQSSTTPVDTARQFSSAQPRAPPDLS
jgi:hypothetical protein